MVLPCEPQLNVDGVSKKTPSSRFSMASGQCQCASDNLAIVFIQIFFLSENDSKEKLSNFNTIDGLEREREREKKSALVLAHRR